MNTNDHETDQLTRRLFADASSEPSPDLGSRIMERLAKEQPLQRRRPTVIHRHSRRFPAWLIPAVVAWLVVVFLLLYMYGNSRESVALSDAVRDKIPYLLTVAAVFGSFPFFRTIDRALS